MRKEYLAAIWIVFIVCVFLGWYFSNRAKHKERMMMIEKGLNVDEHLQKEKNVSSSWLKVGIVIIGLSVGLLIIAIMVASNVLDKGGNALPLAILGICGGIAMVVANYINGGGKSQQ